jgi:hypothetical protein
VGCLTASVAPDPALIWKGVHYWLLIRAMYTCLLQSETAGTQTFREGLATHDKKNNHGQLTPSVSAIHLRKLLAPAQLCQNSAMAFGRLFDRSRSESVNHCEAADGIPSRLRVSLK